MSRFGELLGGKSAVPASSPEPVVEVTSEHTVEESIEPVRARDENGHFIADDPSTPENEAWVGGEAPTKRKKRVRKTR